MVGSLQEHKDYGVFGLDGRCGNFLFFMEDFFDVAKSRPGSQHEGANLQEEL